MSSVLTALSFAGRPESRLVLRSGQRETAPPCPDSMPHRSYSFWLCWPRHSCSGYCGNGGRRKGDSPGPVRRKWPFSKDVRLTPSPESYPVQAANQIHPSAWIPEPCPDFTPANTAIPAARSSGTGAGHPLPGTVRSSPPPRSAGRRCVLPCTRATRRPPA